MFEEFVIPDAAEAAIRNPVTIPAVVMDSGFARFARAPE